MAGKVAVFSQAGAACTWSEAAFDSIFISVIIWPKSAFFVMSLQDTSPKGDSFSPAPMAPAGHRILVVESEIAIADQLVQIMSEMGHVVQVASDARSALFGLEEFEPHLVLLGTYLADMPGYELSAILRGAPQYSYRFRHVALLYVADRNKLLKTRFTGAPDVPIAQYIFKPLVSNEVREKVARAIRQGVM